MEHLKKSFLSHADLTVCVFVSDLRHSCYLNAGRSQQTRIATNVWHQMQMLKRSLQSLSDTCHTKTLCYYLTLSLSSSFLHRCMHILLSFTCSHIHTQTAVVSLRSAVVPCCRLAVTTPGLGLLCRKKACIWQILFRQIKKSMSSCLHQSTHSRCDGSTRYTTALLYLCLFLSLSHIYLFLSGCITFSVSLSPLCLLHLIFFFFCCFSVRL